ncbi:MULTISPECIES: hypothetical protein [Paenibacillus]|uniref:DUF5672 domain-containing protein n=1 Tax=Paenibacillus violae TaxID=3077234 RepID=A0ABU3RIG0_9BACL|nr:MULTISPECIES: hypothetical protein [Paenibacillus]MDU0203607.1 hypothetical protein [Paenibacillus sp. PFR10]MEC0267542.1 hypothetical protein [Paenibacillus anseongense]
MICFALLAHENEPALRQQIRNLRKYNPNAFIVLYNGGTDRNFGKEVCQSEHILYCPYSRPLRRGRTGRFFYDVMRWLEDTRIPYEYLVYTEYDVMFIHGGFESFLSNHMEDYDCLVEALKTETTPHKSNWTTALGMWKEWGLWQPFFQSNHFYGTFNPMQVYRHRLVKKMLARVNKPLFEQILAKTDVFALGEILYMTLAMQCGARCQEYPSKIRQCFRYRPNISLQEIQAASQKSEIMFAHPVKDDSVRAWISAL